jgi:hypothetical protein
LNAVDIKDWSPESARGITCSKLNNVPVQRPLSFCNSQSELPRTSKGKLNQDRASTPLLTHLQHASPGCKRSSSKRCELLMSHYAVGASTYGVHNAERSLRILFLLKTCVGGLVLDVFPVSGYPSLFADRYMIALLPLLMFCIFGLSNLL